MKPMNKYPSKFLSVQMPTSKNAYLKRIYRFVFKCNSSKLHSIEMKNMHKKNIENSNEQTNQFSSFIRFIQCEIHITYVNEQQAKECKGKKTHSFGL